MRRPSRRPPAPPAEEARHFADSVNAAAGSSLVAMDDIASSATRIRTDLGLTREAADASLASFLRYERATGQGSDAVLAFDDILDAWNLTGYTPIVTIAPRGRDSSAPYGPPPCPVKIPVGSTPLQLHVGWGVETTRGSETARVLHGPYEPTVAWTFELGDGQQVIWRQPWDGFTASPDPSLQPATECDG